MPNKRLVYMYIYTFSAVGDSSHLIGSPGTVSADYDVIFNALTR